MTNICTYAAFEKLKIMRFIIISATYVNLVFLLINLVMYFYFDIWGYIFASVIRFESF